MSHRKPNINLWLMVLKKSSCAVKVLVNRVRFTHVKDKIFCCKMERSGIVIIQEPGYPTEQRPEKTSLGGLHNVVLRCSEMLNKFGGGVGV
jgi:hypothetical protein